MALATKAHTTQYMLLPTLHRFADPLFALGEGEELPPELVGVDE